MTTGETAPQTNTSTPPSAASAAPPSPSPVPNGGAAPAGGEAQTSSPAPVSPPSVEAKEAPKTEAAPAPAETLLGAETPKEAPKEPVKAEQKTETKPNEPLKAEAPKADQAKDGSQSETAPLPTYEAFKLPEGVQLEQKSLGEFTTELGSFEQKIAQMTPEDRHKAVQDFGQSLVNRYVSETKQTVQRLNDFYTSEFAKQISGWKDAFMKDPDMGGEKSTATLNSALEFIRTHGGTETQQKELKSMLNATGVGNHPAFIRLLSTAGIALKEGKPLPGKTGASPPQKPWEKMYGKS